MTRCSRCQSGMLAEPFFDDIGSGQALFCPARGQCEETYLQLYTGGLTETQLAELMAPAKPGRRRGGVVGEATAR